MISLDRQASGYYQSMSLLQFNWTTARAVLLGLTLLTALAMLSTQPQGPFDARTYQLAGDVELQFPWQGAWLEPFAAPAHALAGEPDVHVAVVSTGLWIIGMAALWRTRREWRSGRRLSGAGLGAVGKTVLWALSAFLLYLTFVLLIPLPSWQLRPTSPDRVIADLHTHSYLSHDGLVSPEENLRLHLDRGFDVVAVTEHNYSVAAHDALWISRQHPDLPAVLPGMEAHAPDDRGFLLAVGWQPYSARWVDHWQWHSSKQPVIAMAWRLSAADVHHLAAEGVDGFEIANAGHPNEPQEVRAAILAESQQRGLVMLAASDWHGWGGLWRTWNVVHIAGADQMSHEQRAQAVLAALQERRGVDIQPVVAGYMGPPSWWQTLFAPVSAVVRYAQELSPVRVAAWWLWAIVWWGTAALLRRLRVNPYRALAVAVGGVLGVIVLWRGIQLLATRPAGFAGYHMSLIVGGWGVVLGAAVLLVIGLWLLRREGWSSPVA